MLQVKIEVDRDLAFNFEVDMCRRVGGFLVFLLAKQPLGRRLIISALEFALFPISAFTFASNTPKTNSTIAGEIAQETVHSLIDQSSNTWRTDLIAQVFQADDAARIAAIPLGEGRVSDRRIWRFTNHSFFTVKSAYHVAVKKFSRIHDSRPSANDGAPQWKKLWQIDVIPRVRMFLWRACANALPTRANLSRRGSPVDPRCPLCGEEVEFVDHLFVRCHYSYIVWYMSKLRIDTRRNTVASFREMVWNIIDEFPVEYMELFAYTAWEIWRRRNSVCFEERSFDPQEVTRHGHMEWTEYVEGRKRVETGEMERRRDERWNLPHHGTYKINCDVAVEQDGKIGLGFVARDESGAVILAGKKAMRAEGESTLLEGYAMRYAMKMAEQYRIKIERVESDNKNLVEIVNGRQRTAGYCEIIASEIKSLALDVGCRSIDYVPRQHNKVAHQAARGMEFISIRHNPNHLLHFLEDDMRNMRK